MKFNSHDYDGPDEGATYGRMRAVIDEYGNGNSAVTELEFETPAGYAQLMELTVLTGDDIRSENVYTLKNVHTVRIKITGEWEAQEIMQGIADLVHALKLKSTLE